MTAGRWLQCSILSLLLVLSGCGGSSAGDSTASGGMGGSGSGSGSGSGGGQYAEGGMGGSGTGTSSGYGSIYLDDNRRHYPIDENADVFLDGERIDPASINPEDRGLPLGMTLEFVLAGDASADLTSGTAIRIRADHRVIGPVTGTDPLEVLDQPVLVTSETRTEPPDDSSESWVKNLAVGDVVKVDGLANKAGTIRATRLARPSLPLPEWQLIGRAANVVSATRLEVHGQAVEIFNATYSHCDAGTPVEGETVLLRVMADNDFQPGDTLTNTLTVECLPEGLSLFADDPPEDRSSLPANVDAIITGLPADGDETVITLDLNGQKVVVDPTQLTGILFGTLDQLKLGSRIEVAGTLERATGVLRAQRLRFRDPLVVIEAPVDDGIVGELLRTLGIEVRPTPETASHSQFLSPDNSKQVRIDGFVTDDRTVYAERVMEIGDANATDAVRLLGPIPPASVDDAADRLDLVSTAFNTSWADDIEILDLTGTLLRKICVLSCGDTTPPDLEDDVVEGTVGELTSADWDLNRQRLSDGKLEVKLPTGSSP